jgi:hypothetical protein
MKFKTVTLLIVGICTPLSLMSIYYAQRAENVCMMHGYPEARMNDNFTLNPPRFCYKQVLGSDVLVPLAQVEKE